MTIFISILHVVSEKKMPLLKIENLAENHLKIISSETTGPIFHILFFFGANFEPGERLQAPSFYFCLF
jgi:hypothetical protein